MWINSEPALKVCPKCGWKGFIIQLYMGDMRAIFSHCAHHTKWHSDRVEVIREWNDGNGKEDSQNP